MKNFTLLFLVTLFFNYGLNGQALISGKQQISNTVTDIDGNIYKTVKIGSQTWMAENLRTTRYNDGRPIPLVVEDSAWAGSTLGAYCWYNNDSSYKNPYGALYNWWAVSRKICPVGWRVSRSYELIELESFLGDFYNAGGKMKSTGYDFWLPPNKGATNQSGFSAVASGQRNEDGSFTGLGYHSELWLQDLNGDYACTRSLLKDNTQLNGACGTFDKGFSVRCIKLENDVDSSDLQRSLMAYYPFNGNANDESGNGHHGTFNGGTLVIDRFGEPNGAYLFTGAKNTLSFAGSQLQGSTTTIACWVKVSGDNDTVFVNTVPQSLQMILRVENHKYILELKVGDYVLNFYPSDRQIDVDNPRFDFLTLTYNGFDIKFKVNNRLAAYHNFDRRMLNFSFPFTVKNNPEYSFNGILDELRIYNRALDDKEITLLFNDRNRKPPSSRIDSVFSIGYDFAKVRTTLDYYEGDDIFDYGICWSTTHNPDTSDNILRGANSYKLTDLTSGTTYYARAFAINSTGIGYSSEVNFTTAFVEFDTIADIDGNLYKTVKIGNQTWMADNLKTTRYANGEPIKHGHDSIPYVRGKYYFFIPHMLYVGNYYTWAAATNSDSLYNTFPEGIQGVCPDGWHLPNRNDYNILVNYLGGFETAGYKLRVPGEMAGVDYWMCDNGTNESGFSVKAYGIKYNFEGMNYNFDGFYDWAGFWTSESDSPIPPIPEYGNNEWFYRSYSFIVGCRTLLLENRDSFFGLSVRCIKDTAALAPENKSPKKTSADSLSFNVYPNPASDVLYLDNVAKRLTITIYDAQSRVRLKTYVTDGKVNISSLPKGIYFIHIDDGSNSQKKKFIK